MKGKTKLKTNKKNNTSRSYLPLSDELLIKAYDKALKLNLDDIFIYLLEEEINIRELRLDGNNSVGK